MEKYEHFCTISVYLYGELEKATAMCCLLEQQGLDYSYWYVRKLELLHDIETHLVGLSAVLTFTDY